MATPADTNTAPAARSGIGYYAGLDGIRALAIVAVLLYHGGVVWAAGGFLGVEAFFVLSGFLITSLLIAEWRRSGTVALRAFWARRARRLLPALFCLVVVVGLYEALASTDGLVPGLKGDGIATLFYYGNWHEIATGSNYFAATGPVSPLQHTWSLAIEEQFYILWPVSLLAVIWLTHRVLRRSRPTDRRMMGTLLAMSVTLALASAVEAMILFHGGAGANRVYYGTDTRAVGLLTGASLAFALALLRRPDSSERTTSPALGSGALGWCALLALSARARDDALRRRAHRHGSTRSGWSASTSRSRSSSPRSCSVPAPPSAGSSRSRRRAGWDRSPTAFTSGTSRCSCGSPPPRPASAARACWACGCRSR